MTCTPGPFMQNSAVYKAKIRKIAQSESKEFAK